MNLTEMQHTLLTKLFEETMDLILKNDGAESSVYLLRDVCAVFAASLEKQKSAANAATLTAQAVKAINQNYLDFTARKRESQ